MDLARGRHRNLALMAWASVVTYQTAPPQPARVIAASGALIMSGDGIVAGKAGFQKADLMDYGSLYGMGSYYGEDYTAATLVSLAKATENAVALSKYQKLFAALPPDEASATQAQMQRDLQSIDLTRQAVLPDAVATAIQSVRRDTASALNTTNIASGWAAASTLRRRLALRRPISWFSRRLRPWRGALDSTHHGLRTGRMNPSSVMRRRDPHHLDLGQFLLNIPVLWFGALRLRGILEQSRRRTDGPGARRLLAIDFKSAKGRKILSGGRHPVSGSDRRRHFDGAFLLRPHQLLWHQHQRPIPV